jgi:hypothetical protein
MRLFIRRTKRKNGRGTDEEWKELEAHVAEFDMPELVEIEGDADEEEGDEEDEGNEDEEVVAPATATTDNEEVAFASVIPDIEEERIRSDDQLIDNMERQCEDDDDCEDDEETTTRLPHLVWPSVRRHALCSTRYVISRIKETLAY